MIEESNKNYGATLIFWDILFGTRFLPQDRRTPAMVGIPQIPTFPKTFLGQLRVPFRWVKLKQGAVLDWIMVSAPAWNLLRMMYELERSK